MNSAAQEMIPRGPRNKCTCEPDIWIWTYDHRNTKQGFNHFHTDLWWTLLPSYPAEGQVLKPLWEAEWGSRRGQVKSFFQKVGTGMSSHFNWKGFDDVYAGPEGILKTTVLCDFCTKHEENWQYSQQDTKKNNNTLRIIILCDFCTKLAV